MQKRKALDPDCQSEQKKHMTVKEKHIENASDPMRENERVRMETDMKFRTCESALMVAMDKDLCPSLQPTDISVATDKQDILRSTDTHPENQYDVVTTSNSCSFQAICTSSQKTICDHHDEEQKLPDISLDEGAPKSLLQNVQCLFSTDVLALPSIAERNRMSNGNREVSVNDISKSLVNKEEDCLPKSYSSCSDAISTNLMLSKSSMGANNMRDVTSSVTDSSLSFVQDCSSGDSSSLSCFAEGGSWMKISDETSVYNSFMSSVEKENGVVMGGGSDSYDISDMPAEVSSNSVITKNLLNQHKETDIVNMDVSQYKPGRDRSSLSPSLSYDVILQLTDRKYVDAPSDNTILNLESEGGDMKKCLNSRSNSKMTISFCATSDLDKPEYPHIQTKMNPEKESNKDLSFSTCDAELADGHSSDAKLQVVEGGIPGISSMGYASKEVQNSRDKDIQHATHNQDISNNALDLCNGDLVDESGKVSEASGISEEGNPKANASPIRGVIHDNASLADCNYNNLPGSSRKEEIGFSFPTAERFVMDAHSDRSCKGIRSDSVLPAIGNNDDLSSTSCVISGITNCLENEVISVSARHTTVDDRSEVTSDLTIPQDGKSEAVILRPDRNLVTRSRQRKLLVLDLNGILADIVVDVRNVQKAQKKVGGKSVYIRPFCDDFLKFCFEKFDIGVWSSRRKYNVDGILDLIMGDNREKLIFCWDQSHCTYTGFRTLDNVHKPLVLKELKKIWFKEEMDLPWEKGYYSPSNTLLVDDSPYKALRNPPNTAIFPYPYRFDDENDTSLGPGGDLRVYLERLYAADDVQQYVQENPFGQQAITKSDSSWNFYLQVIDKVEQALSSTE